MRPLRRLTIPSTDPDDPNSPAAKAQAQRAKQQASHAKASGPPPPAAKPNPAKPTNGAGASYPVGSYKTLTGDPAKGAVPAGEYNVLEALMGEWESLVGYSVEPSNAQLLAMANQGIQTLADFGKYMSGQANAKNVSQSMPWANYGLTKDEYQSAASTFSTEYKKITGQDISPDALKQAFANPRDPTGGLLNQAQYAQQLMNDTAIQKQFGWVKYGLDFSQWTQQKLQNRSLFGRDINDAEAATILQYNRPAAGSNLTATERQQQQGQPAVAVGESATR